MNIMDLRQGPFIASRIRDIAWWDPVAAYGILLGIPRVTVTLNCVGIFLNTSEGSIAPKVQDFAPVTAVSEPVHQRTWIDRIDYSLTTPQFFPDLSVTSLVQAMLKHQPGVNVRVSVEPEPRYVVSNKSTPLENFANLVCNNWPAGWILFKTQFIRLEYTLTNQPFQITPGIVGEILPSPYIITTTFTGWQFLDPTINKVSRSDARARLRKMGVLTVQDESFGGVGPSL
jgi:hypothetical protein